MANLFLRRGPLAKLQAQEDGQYKVPLIDGAISFTTDEPAIYLDVADSNGVVTRKRVGDLIQVNKIEDLVFDRETMTGVATDKTGLVAEWSDAALYYAIEENALLKCKVAIADDGSKTYSWVQVNATSDIQADITSLTGRVNNLESDLEGVHTSLDDITKDGGLIDQAQATAEATAAADATAKANTAESNAKGYTDGKVTELNSAISGKVDKSTYDTDKEAIDNAIDAVEQSVTDLTNGAVKDLQNAVGVPASQGVEASGLHKMIADEVARATGAEEALGQRIDGVNTTIEGMQTTLGNAATKTELATAKSDLEKYADQSQADAEVYAKNYADGINTTLTGLIDNKADKTTTETALENITKADGLIATAKQQAIDAAALDATSKANTAEANAKGYTDGKVTELNTAIAGKVDKSTYDTTIEKLEGDIAQAVTDAAADATTKANAAQAAAEAAAASALSSAKTEIQGKLDTKVSNETFNTTVATLETKEGADKKIADAIAEVTQVMNAADAMTFKGVVGGEGNDAALPTENVKGGDTYKVGAIGTYADEGVSYVGDLLIAKRDQGADETVYAGGWYHVSSGYEDDYSERLVADDTSATVTLKNTVDKAHGAVQFKAAEDSNVEISMTSTYDEATKSNSSVVTVGMVWGEF